MSHHAPKDALTQIHEALPEPNDMGEPEYAVRAVLTLIHEMGANCTFAHEAKFSGAMFWLTQQALNGLDKMEADLAAATELTRSENTQAT